MPTERQVYVIKVWRDQDNRLRVELRAPNAEHPVYFASLAELEVFFEVQHPPKSASRGLR